MSEDELRKGLAAYVGAGTLARPVGFDSTFLHFYERQSDDGSGLEIYCYTDRLSYAPSRFTSALRRTATRSRSSGTALRRSRWFGRHRFRARGVTRRPTARCWAAAGRSPTG
jgi:hypothetical protein